MAASFTEAFNQAFARVNGVAKRTRQRAKSGWQKTKETIGSWQETRERFEREQLTRSKPRVRTDQYDSGKLARREARTEGGSRELTRDALFRMRVDESPAFMAWVNRIGRGMGVRAKSGETLTQTRLNALIEEFGVKDALELFEYVTKDPDFGFEQFEDAYAEDGKNAVTKSDDPYKLTNAIGMALATDELIASKPIYTLLVA